jgi:hypothetical protein
MSRIVLGFLLGATLVLSGCTTNDNAAPSNSADQNDLFGHEYSKCSNKIPVKVSETRVTINGISVSEYRTDLDHPRGSCVVVMFNGEAGQGAYTSAIKEFGGGQLSFVTFRKYVLNHGRGPNGEYFVSTGYTRNNVTWWIRGEGTNLKDAETNFWSLFTNHQGYFRYHPQTLKMESSEGSGRSSDADPNQFVPIMTPPHIIMGG